MCGGKLPLRARFQKRVHHTEQGRVEGAPVWVNEPAEIAGRYGISHIHVGDRIAVNPLAVDDCLRHGNQQVHDAKGDGYQESLRCEESFID